MQTRRASSSTLEVVLAAVRQNGWTLRYAPEELRQDKEVVMAAVQQRGDALNHASTELRKGGLVKYIQHQLRAHTAFILANLGRIFAIRPFLLIERYAGLPSDETSMFREVRDTLLRLVPDQFALDGGGGTEVSEPAPKRPRVAGAKITR